MSITAPSFIVLEDGTRAKKAGTLVYEGQPLQIASDGTLAPADATHKVYGLSKLDSNNFADFSFGEVGAFGSGQLTVIVKGVVSVGQSIYNQTEVFSNTTTSSAPTTVKIYDDTQTYAPGQALYVDAAGLISNQGTAGKQSLLGKCLRTPLQTGDGSLELEVDPSAATAAAELA